MDGLRTTAPRKVPNPKLLPLPGQGTSSDRDAYAWNVHHERGVPQWAKASRAIPERLEALAARHEDVEVAWHEDPAGTSSIRLPTLTMGREGAPTAVFVAGQHGREPAVPAAAVAWAEQLLAARDSGDPQARWLLDSRRVVLLPIANPRGHGAALDALDDAPTGPRAPGILVWEPPIAPDEPRTPVMRYMDQRKNQSTRWGGVDLNRSHSQGWLDPDAAIDRWTHVTGKTSRDYTRDEKERFDDHPGWTVDSQPETRIIDAVIKREHPTVVADLHQYGNFVKPTAPAGAPTGSAMLAVEKLGRRTGLNWSWDSATADELEQPSDPVKEGGGMLSAHAAARGADLGVTLEFGRSFMPTPADYSRIESAVFHSLTQLLRDADAPRTTSRGPDVSSSPRVTSRGWNVGVSDHASGSAAIAGAELVTDPSAAPGTGVQLSSADGSFDEPVEQVRVPADVGGSSDLVGIRARDADGHWGAVTALGLATGRS